MFHVAIAAAVACAACLPCREAPAYPDRPVKVVVPFAPGGATDVIARIVAQALSDRSGQRFYVENLPGAGGRTGTNLVAHAAPDGHTILVVGSGFVVNPALNASLPYDPIKDFAPVTVVASSPNVIVVHPSVPAGTLAELVAAVKAAPKKFSFASPGAGTLPHLVGELFKQSFGLDIVHVPFNGAGPAIVSTLAGHTPVAVVPVPEATPHVRSGALRALAVTAAVRSTAMPDIPTVAEAGAPGLEAETIQAVLLPAGTAQAIVEQLHRDLMQAMRGPAAVERLAAIGFSPVMSTPAEFGALIEREIAKWTGTARSANLKGE